MEELNSINIFRWDATNQQHYVYDNLFLYQVRVV